MQPRARSVFVNSSGNEQLKHRYLKKIKTHVPAPGHHKHEISASFNMQAVPSEPVHLGSVSPLLGMFGAPQTLQTRGALQVSAAHCTWLTEPCSAVLCPTPSKPSPSEGLLGSVAFQPEKEQAATSGCHVMKEQGLLDSAAPVGSTLLNRKLL